MTTSTNGLAELSINTIRTLSMDAVEKAKSGHPGRADGARPAGLHALHAGDEAQPEAPGVVRPRPLHPLGRARVDAALLDALPLGLRPHARRPQELPPARQPNRRPSRVRRRAPGSRPPPARSARASPCRSGSRSPRRMLAARFNRGDHQLIDHHTYVIASDGDIQEGVGCRGVLARRTPRPRQADRLLRQQPHPARRRDFDVVQRGRRQALRGLRLARAGRGGGPLGREPRAGHRGGEGRGRPALARDRPLAHRLRLAEQAGHHLGARLAARRGRGEAHQGGLRLARRRDLPRPGRGARALRGGGRARRAARGGVGAALGRLPRRGARRCRRARADHGGPAAGRLGQRRPEVQPGRRRGGHAQGLAAGDPVGG